MSKGKWCVAIVGLKKFADGVISVNLLHERSKEINDRLEKTCRREERTEDVRPNTAQFLLICK